MAEGMCCSVCDALLLLGHIDGLNDSRSGFLKYQDLRLMLPLSMIISSILGIDGEVVNPPSDPQHR